MFLASLLRPLRVASHGLAVACALILALSSASASTAPPGSVASTRNEAIVRQAFTAWQGGSNVFAELLAPDVVWTVHGSGPFAGTYRSRDDFVERASRPLISRLATPLVPKVHNIWSMGDTVIIRFEAAATTTAGNRYSNQFLWIFRMSGGSVVEAEAFLDLSAYQRVVDENEPRRP